MILSTVNQKLTIDMEEAIATTNPTVQSTWVDLTTTTTTYGNTQTSANGVTAADIVAAPLASTARKIQSVNIYNIDTIPHIVTVVYNDNGTLYVMKKVTLAVGSTLTWDPATGWVVTDSDGAIITAQSSFTIGILMMNNTFSV
jgi:hypothetical protein